MQRRDFLATAICVGAGWGAGAASAEGLVVHAPGTGFLDLRTGPGAGFDVVFAMPHGSEVHTLEWSGPWVRVRHETGRTGWCPAQSLARVGPSALAVHPVGDG